MEVAIAIGLLGLRKPPSNEKNIRDSKQIGCQLTLEFRNAYLN